MCQQWLNEVENNNIEICLICTETVMRHELVRATSKMVGECNVETRYQHCAQPSNLVVWLANPQPRLVQGSALQTYKPLTSKIITRLVFQKIEHIPIV